MKDSVWVELTPEERMKEEEALFDENGNARGITKHTLYPPDRCCTVERCPFKDTPCKKAESKRVVLYTLGNGAVPAYDVHYYCRGCSTNYHNNYFVRAGQRYYYNGIPDYLQVGEHQYIERRLASAWVDMMVVAWTSATNCARLHKMSHSHYDRDMTDWQFIPKLTTPNVWDAFTLFTLLDDHAKRDSRLQLPHGGDQSERFKAAMQERNLRIIHDGQPELDHACKKCVRIFEDENGECRKVEVAVTDSLTMGHPVCGLSSCSNSLPKNRCQKRFCDDHDYMHGICAVVDCNLSVRIGSMTCCDPKHMEMEHLHIERGTLIFRLRQLNKRAKGVETTEEELEIDENEWFEVSESGEVRVFYGEAEGATGQEDTMPACEGKSEKGNRKIRALFTRRRTHNEQTLVRPCGVIVARATLNSAEGVSSVLDMVKHVNSLPRARKINHLIYDSACIAKKTIKNRDDAAWWATVALTVDTFHFRTKHKESDSYCQTNCNPADYPELMEGDKWYFNSSACEQTNSWFGGYNAIVREMKSTKYNYFLDEVLMRRNAFLVARLERAGLLYHFD